MTTVDVDRAWAYLLGELPEAEASPLDEAVLGEPEAHEAMMAFEAELFDAYVEGALSGERRQRFEQRFLADAAGRERLRRAQALRRVAGPLPAGGAWWRGLLARLTAPRLAVGALVAAALALVLAWPVPAPEVRLSLRPDTVRAGGAARRLEVARASPVLLELALDDAPPTSDWRVAITGPGGFSWRGAPSRADAVAVEVKVDGVAWVSGRYRVTLTSAADSLTYDVEVVAR
ncbi:MAG: hypothetical protein INH41_14270 [Myxococcaceae bacterium]|jgi:hypothetical protein|nr:hypothetical protein [Myxococcaceae bacterium]MCA3013544.1 hypothetical protein [Myxococcaceae bacterium]